MKGIVLDTSALYYGKDLPDGYELVIPPGVVRELDREGMGERLELLMATRIRVSSPSKKSMDKVRKCASDTGDSRRISDTDAEVLALALDLDYQIATDDYSIQNVAAVLGVPCRGMEQKGITQVFEWQARCIGCGKVCDAGVETCQICGSPTKTVRKRKSRSS
jgi:UPF0271 protein